MTLNEYQEAALRTAKVKKDSPLDMAVLALGIAGEAGEVADYVKKIIGHGHFMDREKLTKEIGDCLWYAAVLSDFIGVSLDEVCQQNINKLKKRYPEGFSSERSINREA